MTAVSFGGSLKEVLDHTELVIPPEYQFRAEVRDVFSYSTDEGDDVMIPNRQAFFIPGTDTLLGHASNKYQHVDHLEALERTFDIVEKLELDRSELQLFYRNTGGVQRMHATIRFPGETFKLGDDEREIHAFQIDVINSYDGFTALWNRGGACRLWCLNGCFHGSTIAQYHHKHTKSINTEVMSTKLTQSVEAFRSAPEVFDQMRGNRISAMRARILLQKMLCKKSNPKDPSDFNKAKFDRIISYSDPLQNSFGDISEWEFFQCLTAWATHDDSSRQNADAAQMQREREVTALTQSKAYKDLVTA